jgi:CRP-like cAMP-binding protein
VQLELRTHGECLSFARLATESDFRGRLKPLRKGAEVALSSAFDRIYRLETGRLLLVLCDASGVEVPLREVTVGEFFGEFCFCSARSEHHDYAAARAVESCQVTEIRAGAFLQSLNRSPGSLQEFVSSICSHLARADRRIFALAHRDAEQRLCLLLLEMPMNQKTGEIIATHSEIADFAAMSRPHVSLVLGRLRARGLVSYQRQGPISIHHERIRRHVEQLNPGNP